MPGYIYTCVFNVCQVDEREAQLRQQWADHEKRFKSGAKRSSLRGVIRSSYLTELGGRPDGRAPVPAAAAAARKPLAQDGASSSAPFNDGDDGWEDVRSTDATPAAPAGVCVQIVCASVCASVGTCVGPSVGTSLGYKPGYRRRRKRRVRRGVQGWSKYSTQEKVDLKRKSPPHP